MFKLTRWSIRRTFKLAIVTALFTMAIAGLSPASAQTRSVATAGLSAASAQTRSASGTVWLGRTFDQCSKTVVTVSTSAGPVQVFRGGQPKTFYVPSRRILWSCGSTPEATWLPVGTNFVKIYRQPASQGRRITWNGFFAYP